MKVSRVLNMKFSLIAILIIMGFQVYRMTTQDDAFVPRWQNRGFITDDVREYYCYLPAVFIYHSPGFQFLDTLKGQLRYDLDCGKSPIGKRVGRFTIGMAGAYMPFFFTSHIIAYIAGAPMDGYSRPYQFGLFISGFVYSVFGFIFLALALRRFFTDGITAFTLLCIGLGTNLFYYTTAEGAMSHAVLFTLCAAILYFTVLWHQNPKFKYLAGFSFVFGLAVLIRPTLILTSIIFLLFGVYSRETLSDKLKLLKTHWRQLIGVVIILFIIALPQMIYWKQQTGSYLFYSYANEHFFFLNPHIWKGLFSYRKGWFLYTPMMLLAMVGFVFMRRYAKALFVPVLIFLVLNVYVVLSWWCWWYGGSFGLRAFIDSYAFLSVPLASFWAATFKEGWIARISVLLISGFFCFLNMFQSQQYRVGMLHWDSMSKKLYWATFLKFEYIKDKDNMNDVPNYNAARQGLSETTPVDTIKAH